MRMLLLCVLAAVGTCARAEADYSRIPAPVYAEVMAGSGTEVLIPDAAGFAATGRFKVGRIMDAKIFGQMNEADEKFVRAAAEARFSISGELVRVTFDCPVPPGMTLNQAKIPWNGDRVEFVVRPDARSEAVHYFVAGAGGVSQACRFVGKVQDTAWRSDATIDVVHEAEGFRVAMAIPVRDAFGKVPEPGDVFGVNFRRLGETAGGNSAWAVNGGVFNNGARAFGVLVVGGSGAYFRRRLASLDERVRRLSVDASAAAAVERVLSSVREAIAAKGDDVSEFAALECMFEKLNRSLVGIAQAGEPLLLFEPDEAWGNAFEPTEASKPLARLSVRLPRNSRAVSAFALANLGGAPFVGCLKAVDRDWWYFQWQNSDGQAKKNGLVTHARIRRGVRIYSRERRPLYDPLVDLPVDSLVEVPAGDTHPFYLEIDSHGLAAGVHKGFLKLQSCAPGFSDRILPLEVTVTDDDLDTAEGWRLIYTHIAQTFKSGYVPAKNCLRALVGRGYNTVLLSRLDIYPSRDADGVWHDSDFTLVDRYIDAWVEAGLDRKRLRILPFLAVERDQGDAYWGIRDHDKVRLPFGTPEYDEGFRFMIRSLTEHLRVRHGVSLDRILWYPVDEALGKFPDPTLESPASRGAHAARLIKEVNPANIVFSDPMWYFLVSKDFLDARREFTENIDILVPSRPQLDEPTVALLKACGVPELWCYHVSEREQPATNYRLYPWQNMRDGMRPWCPYWHNDECTGFSFRAKHAYASCYIDFDTDTLSLSRRQLAADLAYEEGKLVDYLKRKFRDDPAKLARIDALVRTAADAGTMKAMDAARAALMEML